MVLSRHATRILRHGTEKRYSGYPMSMDSAVWVRWSDLEVNLRLHCHVHAKVIDLSILAVTVPKARIQLGVFCFDVPTQMDHHHNTFVRACQGISIPFDREERIGRIFTNLDSMLDNIEELWRTTLESHVDGIFAKGIVPGGLGHGRNSCYLLPRNPWNKNFDECARHDTDAYVRIDPKSLEQLLQCGIVVQTATGTVTVWEIIPPTAIMCIIVRRAGQPVYLWHKSLAGQVPTGASRSRSRAMSRDGREASGRGAASARESNAGRNEDERIRMVACPACEVSSASGRVNCPLCYRMTNEDMVEYTINVRNYNDQLEGWKRRPEEGRRKQEDGGKFLQKLVKKAQYETMDQKERRTESKDHKFRKLVSKLHVRCHEWMKAGEEGISLRLELALKGRVCQSLIHCTAEWMPKDA